MWLKICVKDGGQLVPDAAGGEFDCIRCGSSYYSVVCKKCSRPALFAAVKSAVLCQTCGPFLVSDKDILDKPRTPAVPTAKGRNPATATPIEDDDPADWSSRQRRSFAYLLSGILRTAGHDVKIWVRMSGLGPGAIQGYLNAERQVDEREVLRLFLSLLLSEPHVELVNHALEARHLIRMPTDCGRGSRCVGLIRGAELQVLSVRYSDFSSFMRALQALGYTTYRLEKITGYDASAWAHYLSGPKRPKEETLLCSLATLLLGKDDINLLNGWLSRSGLAKLRGDGGED